MQIADTTDVAKESRSAARAAGEESWSTKLLHGVRHAIPMSGKAMNTRATTAIVLREIESREKPGFRAL